MEEYNAYIGLDVHKDTIAVAVAYPGRENAEPRGFIPNTKKALMKLVRRLDGSGERLLFCYEAGPFGYETCRLIRRWGHECQVVAPSLMPRKAGERVKTDRRDAKKLAGLLRWGELTPVWVPDEKHEALRDLSRAREEMKRVELSVKQRLAAFLLRHGKRYTAGKRLWTKRYYRWLSELQTDSPVERTVLEEYVDAVHQSEERGRSLEEHMRRVLETWSLRAVVESLMGASRHPLGDGDGGGGGTRRHQPFRFSTATDGVSRISAE